MSAVTNELWNPRVLLWLKTIGKTTADIHVEPWSPDHDVARINGMPWTVLFMSWSGAMWMEWGRSLGFNGSRGHETALMSGHTREQHAEWLKAKIEGAAS
jgi:hypothetical protein